MPLPRSPRRPRRITTRITDHDAVTELLLQRADILLGTTDPAAASSLKVGRFGSRIPLAQLDDALRRHYVDNLPPYLHTMTDDVVLRAEASGGPRMGAAALADAAIDAETYLALRRRELDIAHGMVDEELLRDAQYVGAAAVFRSMLDLRLLMFNAMAQGNGWVSRSAANVTTALQQYSHEGKFFEGIGTLADALMASVAHAAAPVIVRTPGSVLQFWGGRHVCDIFSYDAAADTVMARYRLGDGSPVMAPPQSRPAEKLLADCDPQRFTGARLPSSRHVKPNRQLPRAGDGGMRF